VCGWASTEWAEAKITSSGELVSYDHVRGAKGQVTFKDLCSQVFLRLTLVSMRRRSRTGV
jgi:hypothetical protein